jgi:hypothetical protein
MRNPEIPLHRAILIVVLAVIAAFILLELWMWTTQFAWSSDPRLMAVPIAIIFLGVLSLIALEFLFRKRRK